MVAFLGRMVRASERGEEAMKLWFDVPEAAPYTGEPPDVLYRLIREAEAGGADFPWDYVRLGRRIKISARSLGVIPDFWWDADRTPRPRNSKAQRSEQAVVATV